MWAQVIVAVVVPVLAALIGLFAVEGFAPRGQRAKFRP